MLSIRPAWRVLSRRSVSRTAPRAFLSTKKDEEEESAVALRNKEWEEGQAALEAEKSPAQRRAEKMTKVDPYMVFGTTDPEPEPKLPDNPAEIATLDTADYPDRIQPDGTERLVHIRQEHAKVTQGPESEEENWVISFQDEGETSQTWENPLMGWVSGADPMASNIQSQLTFRNASEAVYFARKRGWVYIVEEPILRGMRDDEAQYQDNFLPQSVAALIKRDRTQCDHWHRTQSLASHYMRPLKYHGDGTVDQYGPNPDAPVAKHVEGHYKMR